MAEFKKLSEVEQIETASDNATVLVEEGGEIKRISKKEVGGAGGYIVMLTINDLENPVVGWDSGPVISANYDELYDVLCAGGSAWIDYTVMNNVTEPSVSEVPNVYPRNFGNMCCLIIDWCITDIGLIAIANPDGDQMVALFPNGSHNLNPGVTGPK